jgi:hypothetical protein
VKKEEEAVQLSVIVTVYVRRERIKRGVQVIAHMAVIIMENVRPQMERMSIAVQQTVNHLIAVVVKIIVQVYGFQD